METHLVSAIAKRLYFVFHCIYFYVYISTFVQYLYCAQCVCNCVDEPPLPLCLKWAIFASFEWMLLVFCSPNVGGGGIVLGGRGESKPENLEVWWPYATLFVYLFLCSNTYIHTIIRS